MPSAPVAAAPAVSSNTASAPDYSNAFKSPMVGVVYMKPEPSAKEFVVEGQSVKKGDTLCLIEAMKTFNPVKSPKDGVIKKVSRMNEELRELMGYTGVKNVSEFDPAVLWYHGRHFTDNN